MKRSRLNTLINKELAGWCLKSKKTNFAQFAIVVLIRAGLCKALSSITTQIIYMHLNIDYQDFHLQHVLGVLSHEQQNPHQLHDSIGESLMRVNNGRHLACQAPGNHLKNLLNQKSVKAGIRGLTEVL